jgi:ABC-type transporter Mla subunit MlaD
VKTKRSLLSDTESTRAIAEARKELGAALQDVSEAFKTGKLTASRLMPSVIEFLRGRLETVRQALNHFMEGYSEGLKEVRELSAKGLLCSLSNWPAVTY